MKTFCLIAVISFTSIIFAAPQSWKQIAEEALKNGDYAHATEYFQKWTEADPTDAQSLYNLACCQALGKRSDDAVATLRKAAEAGWSDAEHTADDPDLQAVRTRPEYPKILEAIAHNAASHSGGYTMHTCTQQRLGEYIVVLPDDYSPSNKYPLIILLHGYGQSSQEFAKVARMISTHDFIYAVPQGPYTARDSDGNGFSFFRELDNYREDTSSATAAADWIMRVTDDMMKRYSIQGTRAWLVGFNQGAALAHITAARYPERVRGYAAHGGYIIKGMITDKELAKEKQQKLTVLITHAKDDPSVAFMEGVYASNLLRQAGVNVTFSDTDNTRDLDLSVCEKIAEWINAP